MSKIKKSITKAEVLEALSTEPLEGGAWFSTYEKRQLATCSVCAVGAILRKMSFSKALPDRCIIKSSVHYINGKLIYPPLGSELTEDMSLPSDIDDAYNSGNFFSILSCEFETAEEKRRYVGDGVDSDTVRMHALMVAEAFCPEVLEVEVEA